MDRSIGFEDFEPHHRHKKMPSEHEIQVAHFLIKTFGGRIIHRNEIRDVPTSDYWWFRNGAREDWELKKFTGKPKNVDKVLRKAAVQSGNIIIDISENSHCHKEIIATIKWVQVREGIPVIMIIERNVF